MRPETEARIRTVQKFGKNARQFCALAATVLGIALFVNWAQIVAGARLQGGRIQLGTFYSVGTEQLATPSSKIWSFVVVTAVLGASLWMLLHLYRLFKQLEAGSIYTKQNVYHLRQVGWVTMALAVFQMILPAITFGLARIGLIDSTLVAFAAAGDGSSNGVTLFGQSLNGVITASLILLASWIMDVGRQISDDAETMRRDAELVV